MLAAIRAYIENGPRDWNINMASIELALRTAVHTATGVNPFFALFGHNKYTCGSDYKIARKRRAFDDNELALLDSSDRINIIRDKIKNNIHLAYEKSALMNNKGVRTIRFSGSGFQEQYQFQIQKKIRFARLIGNNMYELESLSGSPIGVYHAKDINSEETM